MSKFIGDVSAYAYAVSKGYTGTEEEFAELMASYADVGQTAVDAKDAAVAAKTAAQTAATTATAKASEATTAATTATTKAGEASTSASTATSAKDTAVSASQTATTKATEATTAAATATSAATTATTAKDDAVSAKTAAQTAQTGAETAAASVSASAEQIATNAADISQLKSEKADVSELLKAFPTDSAQGAIASFTDGAELPLKSLTVDIEPVQDGTGDPSPDNVRPISGHTQAVVTRTGVNVWDEEWEVGGIKTSDGTTINISDVIRSKNFNPIIGGRSYYLKSATWSAGMTYIFFYDENKDYIGYDNKNNSAVTAPSNAKFFKLQPSSAYGATYNHDISINYPATDTDYHEGHVQSINISLGQTVYGGTLDVVSGVLTVTQGTVTLTSSMSWYSGYSGYYMLVTDMSANSDNFTSVKCSHFATLESASIGSGIYCNGTTMYFRRIDSDYATMSDWTTFIDENAVKVVYPLATPITVTLTPNELSTLLGANNIWADTGDSTVEYRADPTLYIQRKIAEALS